MKKLLLLIILAAASLASKAQTVSALADSAFSHKDYNKAFEYYSDIVKTDPTNLKALRRRGFCMMNFEGQELNATRFFNEALKVDPKDMASNYYMGVVFMDAAKDPNHKSEKEQFKAKAELYLQKAADYGSTDAKSAISQLNGI
jgi:tetratricopeptide (TPR) repeat protein